MDEATWLDCADPWMMLEFLEGKASDRKRRLFSCACARQFWGQVGDERVQDAIEVSEGYADGLVEDSEREDWLESLQRTHLHHLGSELGAWFRCAADLVRKPMRSGAIGVPACANPNRMAECNLLRDIAGNPFRLTTFDAAYRSHTVQTLARAAYEDRILPVGSFDLTRISVLADALEDAGCIDPAILAHCRQPGEHVRGCWVVDLLLGKS